MLQFFQVFYLRMATIYLRMSIPIFRASNRGSRSIVILPFSITNTQALRMEHLEHPSFARRRLRFLLLASSDRNSYDLHNAKEHYLLRRVLRGFLQLRLCNRPCHTFVKASTFRQPRLLRQAGFTA